MVEQVYRRGQLFSLTQAETLVARVQLRLGKADFSRGEVHSVAGVRLSLMLSQETTKGKFNYEPNPLLREGFPVQYTSCFKNLYSTSIKRCKFIIALLEPLMNSEAVCLQALGNSLASSC